MSDNPVKMILDQAFLRRPERPAARLTIVIRFGDSEEDDPDGERSEVGRFSFFTKEEADAFMTGVEASNGWMSYETIEDGRYPR